jgi:putative thiamine transport system permease protein
LAYPGFATSLRLTLVVGASATLLSLTLAIAIAALAAERRIYRRLQQLATPVLASPHAAIAIGLAFLIAPSGWLVRLAAPSLPPDIVTLQDPWGLAFIAGLLLKEVPYLLLMLAGAAGQVRVAETLAIAAGMGYRRPVAWLKLVLPLLYPQIRLPVYAVLAFSLSVVEVGLVLGPGNPPSLAILATRWFADYDLARYFPASAAAMLQLLLTGIAILLWRLGEHIVAALGRRWIVRGHRDGPVIAATGAAALLGGLALLLGLAALAVMALWSLAPSWRFPALLPPYLTFANWMERTHEILPPLGNSAMVAVASALLALLLAVACLENETRQRLRPGAGALWLLYLPLLVPQIAFLFGAQLLLVRAGLDGTLVAVIWAHLLFVLPYVFLSLADPWRALDPRFARSAAGLGAAPARILCRIKLPMLLRPLLIALAVGFAVSIGQYLPTIFAGAGRVATLTTEAVTLASGGDRRIVGVYAFLQAMLPLLLYGVHIGLPALLFRHRRGLH